MIDWASRIDDLADHLDREYAIHDRAVIEILLAALVDCPRIAHSWLILETNWYSRDCEDAWFSFGESWIPCSLPRIRARFPWREIERETREWLDAPDEKLFIEPDFERYPSFSRISLAQYLLQRSLRIRTRSARAADPLKTLDKFNQDRRTDELAARTRFVLEDRTQARPADPPRFIEPPNFLHYVELVQRLAPWYKDWNTLVKAFAVIAVRRAFLFGRPQTDESDYQAMARVAADSVPPWVAKALRLLSEHPSGPTPIEKVMGLEEKTRRSGHGAYQELIRLRRAGLVRWDPRHMHWAMVDRYRQGILEVLDGQAFSLEGLRAAS